MFINDIPYPTQISHHKQLSSASCNPATAESLVPIQISNGVEDSIQHNSLRAQVQPFQTYTPQQIQEQLQRLHIKQHCETDTVQVGKLLQQSYTPPASREPKSGAKAGREVTPVQDGGSSMLHHLLSQTPNPTSLSSSGQTNPINHQHGHPKNATFMTPQQKPQQNSTITPSDVSAMLGNVASHTSKDRPLFPVNIQAHSPTKGVGRHSPVQDYQMASIAEDTREEVVGGMTDRLVVATHTLQYALSNGLEKRNDKTFPCAETEMKFSNYSTEVLSGSDHTQIDCDSSGNPLRLASVATSTSPPHSILKQILNVLTGNQIQHYQTSGGIVVEHDRVKLLIACKVPHLNTIHMQFIAGDPMQYQVLSSHIAAQLQFTQ